MVATPVLLLEYSVGTGFSDVGAVVENGAVPKTYDDAGSAKPDNEALMTTEPFAANPRTGRIPRRLVFVTEVTAPEVMFTDRASVALH